MTPLTIDKETILVRVNGIEGELWELGQLAKVSFDDFVGTSFKLAQYHLHRALEGVFHITAHLLSRLPGGNEGGTYKEMARLMGEKGLIDPNFAKDKLMQMAGYRNRLVHFYAEITPKELYHLVQHDLGDIETFLKAVKAILQDPSQFGLPDSGLS